ncbi:hypothetical protein [Rossellomorea aquimaris]|uniref:hypothetical protein n=1 Tax=Rossellomorea aquimaris TaxID=189382 RepID=UPI0007D08F39|nr:hypothetical protein [Rossellomorea aquimaris]
MFDPTAFDNLKVVLEGAVYDQDLTGEIEIIDRKDLFDFAHYERCYQIQYCLPQNRNVSIILQLKANMGHFLAERKMMTDKNKAGAEIKIIYIGSETLSNERSTLEETWGMDKSWEWRKVESTLHPSKVEGVLTFNRVITEEMVDDLFQMISFSVKTLGEMDN